MVDIFDEVEEDLRADRLRKTFARYGGLILVLALAVVAGAAGWQGWNWYQTRRETAAAKAFLAAVNQGAKPGPVARKAAAAALTRLAGSAPEGYAVLARLRAAAIEADSGDLAGALALWHAIAADRTAGPLLRDLAALLAVTHQIDTANPAVLRARLAPLALPTNPWHPLAREAEALIDLRLKDLAGARKILSALATDVTAPQDLRRRAQTLLAGITS